MIQLDLFAPPSPPPVIAAKPSRPAHALAFEQQRATVDGSTARAESAGRIERLTWGEGAKDGPMRWGKGGYRLEIYEDGGQWFAREELAMHNGGSSGPFWPVRDVRGRTSLDTREAVILFHMRKLLKSAATSMARPYGDEEARAKQFAKLAAWSIAQCPTLIYGVDLAAEFATLCEAEKLREERRCIALDAVHDLAKRVDAVMKSIDVDAYSGSWDAGLIHNKAVKDWPGKGADPVGHAKAWPAEWAISGHAPAALSVTIYPRVGQAESRSVRAAVGALTIALAEPILIADEDAPYPHGNWKWEDQ
jgi:hypothetical protein